MFLTEGVRSTTNRALAIFEDNQLVKQRQVTQKYSSQLNKYDNRSKNKSSLDQISRDIYLPKDLSKITY